MFLIILAIVAFMFILAPSIMLVGLPILMMQWALLSAPVEAVWWIPFLVIAIAVAVPAKYWPKMPMELEQQNNFKK